MTTPEADLQYFEKFEIQTTLNLCATDGQRFQRKEHVNVSRRSFREHVRAALQGTPRAANEPFCLVTLRTAPAESFTSREHLVPEGLGLHWAVLPAGVGTCDRVNKALGAAELEWLRFGPMGAFRPFYVPSGKDEPPEFHAPKKSERLFSFVRNSEGRRQMEVFSDDELGLLAEGGKGELTIRTRASDANSTRVSLAVHKLAYLTFWLARSDASFDPAFNATRAFLSAPSEQNYRPVWERIVPGSAPGLTVHFAVGLKEVVPEPARAARAFEIDYVHAIVHAHHMLYCLALAGDLPLDARAADSTVRTWEPLDSPPRLRFVEFVFGADGIRRSGG